MDILLIAIEVVFYGAIGVLLSYILISIHDIKTELKRIADKQDRPCGGQGTVEYKGKV